MTNEIPFEGNLVYNENAQLDENASTFGLVELADVAKAIGYQEKSLDANSRAGGKYRGIMIVAYGQKDDFEKSPLYCPWGQGFNFFREGEEFFDPFNNIGLGISHLFGKLTRYSDYSYSAGKRSTPSISNWRQTLNFYRNGGFYSKIILDELVYKDKVRKRNGDKIHNQSLLP